MLSASRTQWAVPRPLLLARAQLVQQALPRHSQPGPGHDPEACQQRCQGPGCQVGTQRRGRQKRRCAAAGEDVASGSARCTGAHKHRCLFRAQYCILWPDTSSPPALLLSRAKGKGVKLLLAVRVAAGGACMRQRPMPWSRPPRSRCQTAFRSRRVWQPERATNERQCHRFSERR
jgi:hypothetical protein